MKKVLALVLALTMVLGSFSFVSAATFPDTTAKEVTVLSGLGVINGYPDGTFKPANIVTRAEMAKMIIVALGLEDFAVATTSPYSDMWQASWAQGFVSYATSLGIITGYPDGTFKPNQTVSYNEASAMIVRALGYTSEFLPGEWPAEWVVKAKTLGILDGITAATAAGATRGDIAKMLYQSLQLPIGYVTRDNLWQEFANDKMLKRLGATEHLGVVVDGSEDSLINLRSYVGKRVDLYMNSDDEIIFISRVRSTMLEGKFTADVAAGVMEDGQVFKADGVEYTVNVPGTTKAAIEFVNGDIQGISTYSKDVTYVLEASVSGKTLTDVYTVSLWTLDADTAKQFRNADAQDIEEDQELFGKKFVLDNSKEIDLDSFELIGADSLEDIDKDNVVYVYASGSGLNTKIRKIVVGTEVVEGEVERFNSAATKFTVDGKVYEKADAQGIPSFTLSAAIGDEVELVLDGFGKIFKMNAVSASTSYAVVLDSASGSGTGLNAVTAKVKLFLADGTNKVFSVNKTTTNVAGYDKTDYSIDGINPGMVVKYGVNSDGEISTLTTTSAIALTTAPAGKVVSSRGYYDGKAISSTATIFGFNGTATADLKSASKYDVIDLEDLLGTTNVKANYVVNSSNQIVAMMVMGKATTTAKEFGVVSAWGENNSDAGYYVDLLVDAKAVTYNATDVSDNYKQYLVEVSFNSAGDATLTKVTTGAAIYVNSTKMVSRDGYVITTTPGGVYTMDSDVVIYKWDGAKFVRGSFTDLAAGTMVHLFDTDATDSDFADDVIDIVLIKPAY